MHRRQRSIQIGRELFKMEIISKLAEGDWILMLWM